VWNTRSANNLGRRTVKFPHLTQSSFIFSIPPTWRRVMSVTPLHLMCRKKTRLALGQHLDVQGARVAVSRRRHRNFRRSCWTAALRHHRHPVRSDARPLRPRRVQRSNTRAAGVRPGEMSKKFRERHRKYGTVPEKTGRMVTLIVVHRPS